MRVLITGSAGNIGREQTKAVQAAGHEIRSLDSRANSEESDWEHLVGDIRDLQIVRSAVEGMDAVIHLGAIPGDKKDADDEVLSVNVQGTWNVLIACAEAGVGRVVNYSSVNSLGNFQGHRPSLYLPIDDAYPRHPISPYQLSKHLGEEACKCYSEKHGMVTISLRPMWVVARHHYAHWQDHQSERRVEWGRKDYWAYVDMRDVCDAGVRALTVENVRNDAFLLAARNTLSNIPTMELLDRFYSDTPWHEDRAAFFAADPYRSVVDCSHAKDVLGWEAQYSWRTEAEASA